MLDKKLMASKDRIDIKKDGILIPCGFSFGIDVYLELPPVDEIIQIKELRYGSVDAGD